MHYHPFTYQKKGSPLFWVFLLNLFFTLIEWIGGTIVNSSAILADALHDAGDAFILGLAWFLEKKSLEKGSPQFTFGYRRFNILSATLLGIILLVGSGFLLYFGIERLIHPEQIKEKGMLLIACLGLLFNGISTLFLYHKEDHHEAMIRWHLIEDVLGWLSVLIGSLFIYFFQWYFIDGLLTILIALFILFQAGKRLISIVQVLLQAAPSDISPIYLKKELLQAHPAIKNIHHLHLWTLDGTHHIFTAHIVVPMNITLSEIKAIKQAIYETLNRYPIHHVTLEIESENEACFMGSGEVVPGEWS